MKQEDKDKKIRKPHDYEEQPSQGRADFNHSDTTQGGSNYGQGSGDLGPEVYDQGQVKNEGSNYANERKNIPGNNNRQDIEYNE